MSWIFIDINSGSIKLFLPHGIKKRPTIGFVTEAMICLIINKATFLITYCIPCA